MRFVRSPRRVTKAGITRRSALRQLGAATGAVALAPWLPGCSESGTSASDVPLEPEELDVETVIHIMMENRSFDHYFGSLSLVEGRPVDGLSAGLSNMAPNGQIVSPYATGLHCVADPPHGWDSNHRQFNNGANDGFVREYAATLIRDGLPTDTAGEVMGYLLRNQLPVTYALADEFVLCEKWFCSLLSATWPNRMYLHSAQSNGRMNNAVPDAPGFQWPTIYDRLSDAGIDWKCYYSDISFLFLWEGLRAQMNQRFGRIEQFIDDARSGSLPPVCHVEPLFVGPFGNDDHPPRDFVRGQAFLSTILRALADGPQWSRSLVIITYDEHGGFYDHVAPPMVDDERSAEGFGQLGFRVPGLVISPYARQGFVSPTLYEHSSVPAVIEWLFGLAPLTVRDAQANYFLDTFDIDRIRRRDPRPMPEVPILAVDPDVAPECEPFGVGNEGEELVQAVETGVIPAQLDRRREAPDLLRTINRELIALGGGRPVRA
jgi:phospholipase C